jgi:hypothetical protein
MEELRNFDADFSSENLKNEILIMFFKFYNYN